MAQSPGQAIAAVQRGFSRLSNPQKFAILSATALVVAALAVALLCVRGTDHPDTIIMSNDVYTAYQESLQDLQRYADVETAAAGFKTLKYWTSAGAADVVHDSNSNFSATAERAYFINSETWDLCVHRDANWTLSDRRFSNNQDAFTQYILWMGAPICKNRKLNGILIDAS